MAVGTTPPPLHPDHRSHSSASISSTGKRSQRRPHPVTSHSHHSQRARASDAAALALTSLHPSSPDKPQQPHRSSTLHSISELSDPHSATERDHPAHIGSRRRSARHIASMGRSRPRDSSRNRKRRSSAPADVEDDCWESASVDSHETDDPASPDTPGSQTVGSRDDSNFLRLGIDKQKKTRPKPPAPPLQQYQQDHETFVDKDAPHQGAAPPTNQSPANTKPGRKSSSSSTVAPSIISRQSTHAPPSLSTARPHALEPCLDKALGEPQFDHSAGSGESKSSPNLPSLSKNGSPVQPLASSPASAAAPDASALGHRRSGSNASFSAASEQLRQASLSAGQLNPTPSPKASRARPGARRSNTGYFNNWFLGSSSDSRHQKSNHASSTSASPSNRAAINGTSPVDVAGHANDKNQGSRKSLISKFYSPNDRLGSAERSKLSTRSDVLTLLTPVSSLRPSKSTVGFEKPSEPSKKDPSPLNRKSGSSASLSRTQQKLLMQRDAPVHSVDASKSLLYPSTTSSSIPSIPGDQWQGESSEGHSRPTQQTSLNTPAMKLNAQANLQSWAQAIVREADRIDRDHSSVRRFHDPVKDSLQRVLHVGR